MLNSKFVLILFVIVLISALVVGSGLSMGQKHYGTVGIQSGNRGTESSAEAPKRSQSPQLLGKIGPPADLSIGLEEPQGRSDHKKIVIHAVSQVPVKTGLLKLQCPPADTEPGDSYVLWSGNPYGFVDHTAEFTADLLPSGRYRFVAVFEFTPDFAGAEKLAVSKSLYIDSRATRVLSSNVSFKHIDRLELKRELEHRVLKMLKPRLANADPETMASELALMKTSNPGLIAEKVAELKATDPEVARRVVELNRIQPQTQEPAAFTGEKSVDY